MRPILRTATLVLLALLSTQWTSAVVCEVLCVGQEHPAGVATRAAPACHTNASNHHAAVRLSASQAGCTHEGPVEAIGPTRLGGTLDSRAVALPIDVKTAVRIADQGILPGAATSLAPPGCLSQTYLPLRI
jgi:hypothetical protein